MKKTRNGKYNNKSDVWLFKVKIIILHCGTLIYVKGKYMTKEHKRQRDGNWKHIVLRFLHCLRNSRIFLKIESNTLKRHIVISYAIIHTYK